MLPIITHHGGKEHGHENMILSKHVKMGDSPMWGEKSKWARRVLVFIH